MKLRRPMSSYVAPSWSGAKWVGEIDYASIQTPDPEGAAQTIYLEDADNYTSASLLVRSNGNVMGFIDVPVYNSFMTRTDIEAAAQNLPVPTRQRPLADYPQFTVAICTHNRADMLDEALASVLRMDYPNFKVLVVENAPLNDETALLLERKYPSVQYAVQPVKGLSHARNLALKLTQTDYLAFTDDDVVVDPQWLHALAATFAEDENIACVTGLVPSGEFISPTQAYFDQRVTWSHILEKSYYSLANPPQDVPAFPFAVGRYGTGANFALRRSLLPKKMNFDPAFGAGTLTGGGEDIDFFTRVLFAKRILAVNPDAIVWHRHRSDEAALTVQAKAYGIGLGAWLTKLALNPRMWLPLAKRVTAGRRQLRNLGDMTDADVLTVEAEVVPLIDPGMEQQIRELEKKAVIKGPGKYFRQQLRNLRAPKTSVINTRTLDQVLRQYPLLWGGAVIAAAQALLLIPGLPAWARGLVLGVFIFTQPGMLFFYRRGLTTRTRLLLILGISLSTSLILTTFAAMSQVWYPQPTLLALAGVVVVGHVIATIREVRKPV